MLVKNGIITESQLSEALALQHEQSKRLGELLIELGYIRTKDLIWMLSEQAALPFVELRPEMLDAELINSFPEKLLYDNHILPLYTTNEALYVALGDPTDTAVVDKIKVLAKKEVVVSGAEPNKIIELLDKFFFAQQTEKIIEPEFKGKINVHITNGIALVELIDESGAIVKTKLPVNITINIGHPKGAAKNERD